MTKMMQLLNSNGRETPEQVLFRLKNRSCTGLISREVSYTPREVHTAKKVLAKITEFLEPESIEVVIAESNEP